MATHSGSESSRQSPSSCSRAVAMLLSLVAAVALSPLYANRRRSSSDSRYERMNRWSGGGGGGCGFVQPMLLAAIIVAIKAVSSSSSQTGTLFPSMDSSFVVRFGSSCWGLGGVLVMLLLVLSWQQSVQEFFWR